MVLAPPVFVLAPLAGLLLVARPSTGREWFWLGAGGLLVLLSLAGPAGVAGGFVRAAGVLAAGAFVALSLWRGEHLFSRAVAATSIGFAAALFWSAVFGIGWGDIERAIGRELRELFLAQSRLAEARSLGAGVVDLLRDLANGAAATAAFYPALLVLTSIAGLTLAWRCHHWIARRPIGIEGGPFTAFRFSDQAIWLLVGALAVVLLPRRPELTLLGSPLQAWAANLLAVMCALYVARGLAVFATASRRAPRRIVAVLSVVSVFLWPFAAGGLVLLGLADSWVDFRRRLESPPTGGIKR